MGKYIEIEDPDIYQCEVLKGRMVFLAEEGQDYFELTRKDVVRMVKAMGITKAELIVAGIT